MSFLNQIESDFQHSIDKADISMMEAVTNFLEEFGELNYCTESTSDTLVVKLKKFFADIIASFKNFSSSIRIEVNKKLCDTTFNNKLRSLYKDAEAKQAEGVKKLEIVDIEAYTKEYLNAVNDLKSYAKKFSNMKYKHVSEIDKDIAEFNTLVNSYEQSIDEISKKKIKVKPAKVMEFVENELSGRSKVFATLNDAITLFEHMKDDCSLLESRRDILGPDIIAKKVGFIKKITTRISSFIKRHVVKFISTIVLIVG